MMFTPSLGFFFTTAHAHNIDPQVVTTVLIPVKLRVFFSNGCTVKGNLTDVCLKDLGEIKPIVLRRACRMLCNTSVTPARSNCTGTYYT